MGESLLHWTWLLARKNQSAIIENNGGGECSIDHMFIQIFQFAYG